MNPHDRHEDPTLAGTGPAIKDPSSSGMGTSGLYASKNVPVEGGSAAAASPAPARSALLEPGTILAGRYEILQLLGQGGMGAVYKALDRELERPVALKVILPELASNPAIAQRFKQELLLARKVTHKNVIRIYDIGEAAGLKFITMDFVEGETLRDLLHARGRLNAEETVRLSKQICQALEAAHAESVIHRDLKPANIMVESNGRVLVMDFGLARSQETDATQTGGLVGTLEYMSPEQARSEPLDARSDLYSLGLIMYEMLTSTTPFKCESALAGLFKRTQSRPDPPSTIEQSTPQVLNAIVTKCLEPDRNRRYKSASEIIADLQLLEREPKRARLLGIAHNVGQWTLKAALIAAALAIVVVGVYFIKSKIQLRNSVAPAPVSVLIADFKNNSSESIFEGSIEAVLKVGLEGAPFITTYDRGNARRVLARVKNGAPDLDLANARLVAQREGVNVVISGGISRDGSQYQVSATAQDAVTGNVIGRDTEEADRQDVLRAVNKLAARLRTSLGDKTPESTQIAAAETFTTTSLDAAHEYALAQEAHLNGRWPEAIAHYTRALEFDPDLGRAYVGLANAFHNSGQPDKAKKYYELALSKVDRMSEREKYRTRGAYYLLIRDSDKAIEQQTQLVKEYPSDVAGLSNLALAYFYRRDMAKALELGREGLKIYPHNVIHMNNVGLYAMYASDFESAIREQQEVLALNEKFVLGYVGTALPQLALGNLEAAKQTYGKLAGLNDQGASASAAGLADVALYEGRANDAISILEKGAAADAASKNSDGQARKLALLALANLQAGKKANALPAAGQAAKLSPDTGVQYFVARTYIEAGQSKNALSIATQLERSLEADPQAYGKLIEAEAKISDNDPRAAIRLIQESRQLADTWMGRFDEARALLQLNAFAEAQAALDICMKRRGEATALFLDESPTYFVFPPVYYYLGRAQEGLQSPASADSYKAFLGIKANATSDSLVADARRRTSR